MPILQAICEYKNVHGCSVRADVYPAQGQRAPVLVCIHGGALISGSRRYLSPYQRNLYRRAGFALVSIDYRLAPETRLASIVEDIQDALRWVRDEGACTFGYDPGRLAVMGSSAGGYLSLVSGTFNPPPRAIVSFYGYGDILGDWYTRPSAHYLQQLAPISREEALACVGGREKSSGGKARFRFYLYCRQQGIWPREVSGCDPLAEKDELLRFCPAYNAHPGWPPTLLLHGDRDTDVPYEQSVQMSQVLARQGTPNTLITIPGGGHGFDHDVRNPNVRSVLDQVVDFLKAQC